VDNKNFNNNNSNNNNNNNNNLWDIQKNTNKNIAANRLHIVLKNKEGKTCLLIDMTIPLDTNTSVKTTEKLNKYKDMEMSTTIPVVMGTLGTIKKDMENYTSKIPGNINIHEFEKITLLSIVHFLRRVLSIK